MLDRRFALSRARICLSVVAIACTTGCGGGSQGSAAIDAGWNNGSSGFMREDLAGALSPLGGKAVNNGKAVALGPSQGQATQARPGIDVDMSNPPVPKPGVSEPMLSAAGPIPPAPAPDNWEHGGAFRLLCNWSKMGYDDPIVYPDQPGASHNHTFFGNTAIDAFTTSENIRSKGNATCRGGTINLSGYWVPTMVDTASHQPIAPKQLLIYYKTGMWPYMNDNSVMQPLPQGLKIIAGNAMASEPGAGSYSCMYRANGGFREASHGKSIPTCTAGEELWTHLEFPQCWDGVNLDSPDHKSHMAFPEQFWSGNPQRGRRCPLTHPVVLPQITFIVIYTVPAGSDTHAWRLASDMYDPAKPAGYSLHGDYMEGWDPKISELWGIKCMRERRDCGSANLGDGRSTREFQGN